MGTRVSATNCFEVSSRQTTGHFGIAWAVIHLQHIFHVGDEGRVGIRRNYLLLFRCGLRLFFLASARSCCRWHARRCSTPRPDLLEQHAALHLCPALPGAGETGQRDQFRLRRAVENPHTGHQHRHYRADQAPAGRGRVRGGVGLEYNSNSARLPSRNTWSGSTRRKRDRLNELILARQAFRPVADEGAHPLEGGRIGCGRRLERLPDRRGIFPGHESPPSLPCRDRDFRNSRHDQ